MKMVTEIKFKVGKTPLKLSFNMKPHADLFREYLQSRGIKMSRELKGRKE